MSDAFSIQSLRATWPLMSSPRMTRAFCSASAGSSASLTPPALPRPPVRTCALTTTGPPSEDAAARASSGETARWPSDTGMPTRRNSSLPWYSYRSTAADSNDPRLGCRLTSDGTFCDWPLRRLRHVRRRLRARALGRELVLAYVVRLRCDRCGRRDLGRRAHLRELRLQPGC